MVTQLLTATEAAERLRVSRSMVYLLAQRGTLPCARFGEHAVRFPADALERWLAEQVQGGRQTNENEKEPDRNPLAAR